MSAQSVVSQEFCFFFQAEDGIRDHCVTGVQTCALPIYQKQLRPLLKAAFAHAGTAVLDVISPCVTFADHEGSTKSYAAVKEHDAPLHDIEYVPYFEDITVEYEPGRTREVTMPDGSRIYLKKLAGDYDPTDSRRALEILREARDDMKLVTGLLYVDTGARSFDEEMKLIDEPLAGLPLERVRPAKTVLEAIMSSYREGSAPV